MWTPYEHYPCHRLEGESQAYHFLEYSYSSCSLWSTSNSSGSYLIFDIFVPLNISILWTLAHTSRSALSSWCLFPLLCSLIRLPLALHCSTSSASSFIIQILILSPFYPVARLVSPSWSSSLESILDHVCLDALYHILSPAFFATSQWVVFRFPLVVFYWCQKWR